MTGAASRPSYGATLSSEPPLWPAYARWRAAAGPLADFVLPAAFLGAAPPQPRRPSHPVARRAAAATRRLASLEPDRTAVFLEAAPRLGLAVAGALLPRGWSVAPLFGRWPVDPPVATVLPAEPQAGWLAWLAGEMDLVRDPKAGPLCLLLDSERHRPVSRRALRQRFDNRYEYTSHMLPPAERLLALSVRRTVWMGPAALVPGDLESCAAALVAAGIQLDLTALPPALSR